MKNRCQVYNCDLRRWVKYEVSTSAVMQVKHDSKPFARIRRQTLQDRS